MTHLINEKLYPFLELKELPRLPIPPLDETLDKYTQMVKALLVHPLVFHDGHANFIKNRDQYEQTIKNIEEFRKKDGPFLDKKLRELRAEAPTSWLEGWWDSAYLEGRDPLPINVNPFFMFEEDSKDTQISRATSLIHASLEFYLQLASNQLEADRERDTKLCMSQFGRIFSTVRIPHLKRDELVTYKDSKHIVVLSKGQFYWFNVLSAENWILAREIIESNLKHILKESSTSHLNDLCLGPLSTLERDRWASLYAHLRQVNPINESSLDILNRALFVVCLDDEFPTTKQQMSQILLHSDGRNRFFDKSIQLIVTANGKSGIHMEHSGMDGHTILRYAAELHNITTSKKDVKQANFTSLPKALQWRFSPPLLKAIAEAEDEFQKEVQRTSTSVLVFNDYGKRWIVSQKCSPDAFIQMAFQLAYFKLMGVPCSTYESGLMKRFYHGRTETVRSCSMDSVAFTKTFPSPQATTEEKISTLRKAIQTHVDILNFCKAGQGVDRHLFGLHQLAKHRVQDISGYSMPAIFTDPTYGQFKTDLLSTSNCGNQHLCLFGFGPTAVKGFGLGYIIRDNSVYVNITSFQGAASQYKKALEEALTEMKHLLNSNPPASKL